NLGQDSLFVVAFFMRQQNKGDENRSKNSKKIQNNGYDFIGCHTLTSVSGNGKSSFHLSKRSFFGTPAYKPTEPTTLKEQA
ncbi:hypothetical protein, partial [uncultured Dubosiella sp.]|uniref:hypothetical protein n=1 Tax=uncultured Dubosiella sp. TaxID=1937011 RepID=UPI0025B48826